MEAICGADKEYLKTTTLRDQHDDIKRRTIDNFRSNLKKGGPDFSQDYEGKLKAELDDLSRKYIEHNESKEDLLNLTADFRNFIAMTNARKKFQEDMDAERGGVQEYMKAAFFQFGLYTVKTIATEFVHSIINTGELDLDQDHEERLITELDDLVPLFIEHRSGVALCMLGERWDSKSSENPVKSLTSASSLYPDAWSYKST
ncbi:hypothetical protein CAPTEDRAFT_213984 [Capitella teleta]|uniref:Uncharacterized protein n=1 Tax=Capitella teleta TaxID=283909 RepID=R7TUX1_CAPTE|nr:hypothetical protein CAPTEDRAFT_213984 [Capitella teleta]|eukprot:ELT95271.1 hypothetical protein CAPTEDRAFT_213984 [Capitella teleta]